MSLEAHHDGLNNTHTSRYSVFHWSFVSKEVSLAASALYEPDIAHLTSLIERKIGASTEFIIVVTGLLEMWK